MKFLKLAVTAALFAAGPTWAQSLNAPQNNAARSAKQDPQHIGLLTDGTYSPTVIRCWRWL